MFVLPEEYAVTFAPQSAWGRAVLQDYSRNWNRAMETLLTGLRRQGKLHQALAPEGLRIPMTQKAMAEVPEYVSIDRLAPRLITDECDLLADDPACFLEIRLKRGAGARYVLTGLRIVDREGRIVPLQDDIRHVW